MNFNVISAFPGTGKSHFVRFHRGFYPGKWTVFHDSDSSKFPKENNAFPSNYIEHIKSICDRDELILASSHDSVRTALKEANIPFLLIFPDRRCKAEYLKRYQDRGSPSEFIELMNNNWDDFIDSCMTDENCTDKVILKPGTYLSDGIRLSVYWASA